MMWLWRQVDMNWLSNSTLAIRAYNVFRSFCWHWMLVGALAMIGVGSWVWQKFYFYGGTLMTNCRPLPVSVICPLRAVTQQFYVGLDRFVLRNVFLSVFWWIYCYGKRGQQHTFSSRRFGLSGPYPLYEATPYTEGYQNDMQTLILLQYV